MKSVICIMGKSGSGKSTLINQLEKFGSGSYVGVKSKTTRAVRADDPNDINTHIFVDGNELKRDEDNSRVISKYISPKGYVNWTSMDCFTDNKINLYAIDKKAYNKFKKNTQDFRVVGVYIHVDEDVRIKRLNERGDSVYDKEDFLDASNVDGVITINGSGSKNETFVNFISGIINGGAN